MTPRIRTALLTTAVALGMLLSGAPAQALTIQEQSAIEIPATDVLDSEASEANAVAPGFEDVRKTLGNVALEPEASNSADDAGTGTELIDASGAGSSDTVTRKASELTPKDLVPAESTAYSLDDVAAEAAPAVDSHSEVQPMVVLSKQSAAASTSHRGVPPSGQTLSNTSEVPLETAAGTLAGNPADTGGVSFWERVEEFQMPEGSDAWNEAEWNAFLETPEGMKFSDQYMDEISETAEFDVISELIDNFMDKGDQQYLDQLMDYLLELFDGNGEWAWETYNGIIQGLIHDGFLEAENPGSAVPPASESPKATLTLEKAVVKPAGSSTKPTLANQQIVQAMGRPVIHANTSRLADTGSSTSVVVGGSGVLLVLLGAIAVWLRRKSRAH